MSSVSPLPKPLMSIVLSSALEFISASRSAVPEKLTDTPLLTLSNPSVLVLSSVKLLPESAAVMRAEARLRSTSPPWKVFPAPPVTSSVAPFCTAIRPSFTRVPKIVLPALMSALMATVTGLSTASIVP